MSCKPLTRKEWQASLAEMWEAAVESTYKDLIAEAVAAEREACAKAVLAIANDDAGNPYKQALRIGAEAIRARGQA